jgi:hypothetical protein
MNKKILSLAVAAAVAAPMAAQADVTVNGAVSRDMYNESISGGGSGFVGGDSGTSKLEINVKEGNAFAKIAFDIRPAAMPGSASYSVPTTASGATTASSTLYGMPAREQYAGVKTGGLSISVGRLASAYAGTLKVDTMTANFLEARNRAGGVSKVASFNSGMLGFSGSAGDISYNLQYGPAYVDYYGYSDNPVEAGVKFAAGPATVGLGFQSDKDGNSTAGVSAKMKFGDIAVGASYENDSGGYGAGCTAGTACNMIFADVAMPMGAGTAGLGIGSNTDASTTFARVSWQMKVSGAATLTVGGSSADGDTRMGAGLAVKF